VAVRILIVDDDKFTRSVLETMLRQEPSLSGVDLDVATAEDGQAGLTSFGERPADIVVVDLLMPKLDGFETCKALRDSPAGVSAEVVVMSGVYRDAAIRNRVKDEFGAHFFAKPAQLKELARHVGQAVARRKLLRTKAPTPAPPSDHTELPARNGDLTLRALPAVLLDLHESAVTGQLVVRRGRVTKVIDLQDGNPVSATSSARDETLGHFLVVSGVITDDQHKQAIARAAEKREKVGEALIALGVLTPERLTDLLLAQTRHKLVQALRWPAGAWRFEPRPPDPGASPPIPMIDLVLSGLRDTADPTAVSDPVLRLGTQPLELTDRGHRLAADVRRIFGDRVVDAIRPGVTLDELEKSGIERAALITGLDALARCDAITTRLPAVGAGGASGSGARKRPQPELGRSESTDLFIERRLSAGTVPENSRRLYELLFEDSNVPMPLTDGDLPLELADGVPGAIGIQDSGLVDIGVAAHVLAQAQDEATAARRALLKEYLRIQGLDHYGVLLVDRRAGAAEIAAALAERQSRFAIEYYGRYDLGRDQSKLDEIRAAYEKARETLLDDAKRHAFDRELAGGDLVDEAPSLDAEIAYRAAEDLMARRQYPAAIAKLTAAVTAAPNEADYHAVLGWAQWLDGTSEAAADLARPHLNQALAINPDHAAAHDYRGRIDAALGTDDALAAFHLERALDLEPGRTDALAALENIFLRRGDARPLERLYRRLLYRTQNRSSPTEVALWMRLGQLYREHLDDLDAARAAFTAAQKIAPQNPSVAAAIAELDRASRPLDQSWDDLRARWRSDLTIAEPGLALFRAALAAERHDASFMVASALVATGEATPEAEALYQRHRPRFVIRAQRPLSAELWPHLRHADDGLELGTLMEILAPVVRDLLPMTLDDLEVDETMRIGDGELPAGFLRMRSYLCGLLEVATPIVYVRSDFGRQIHVGAVDPPVLLAGDDALAAPERGELAFRLARAMTYLWPGRAVGGSRPARLLKRVVLAVFADAAPAGTAVPPPDVEAARAQAALAVLSDDARQQARALVLRLVSRSPQFNLSRWTRGLARTADRAGLVACGDLPAAIRFAADGGSTEDDLIDFAISPAHLALRAELGLSIDV
jgi:CheY-like chemotaxis protein